MPFIRNVADRTLQNYYYIKNKLIHNIIISLIFDKIDTVTSSTYSVEDCSLRISSEMR